MRSERSVCLVFLASSLNNVALTLYLYNKNKISKSFCHNFLQNFVIIAAEIKPSVKRLYLNGNRLKALDTVLQNTQMEEVQIAGNQIEYLAEGDFHDVHSTNNLEFQENKIQRIDTKTFEPLRNHLHYLDLSYNFITTLNGSLRYISQLKLLNLTHNLIQVRFLFFNVNFHSIILAIFICKIRKQLKIIPFLTLVSLRLS